MISASIDGELADAETAKLFFYPGECAVCRMFMKSVSQLRNALKEIEVPAQTSSTAILYGNKSS